MASTLLIKSNSGVCVAKGWFPASIVGFLDAMSTKVLPCEDIAAESKG